MKIAEFCIDYFKYSTSYFSATWLIYKEKGVGIYICNDRVVKSNVIVLDADNISKLLSKILKGGIINKQIPLRLLYENF